MRFLALLFLSFPALAQVESFRVGEDLSHMVSVCLSKQSALDVAAIDAKDGFSAAHDAFDKKDDCAVIPVTDATVGKVVHSAKVRRGDTEKTLSVVEIIENGKVTAYFLTSMPVVAKLSVVPKGHTNS